MRQRTEQEWKEQAREAARFPLPVSYSGALPRLQEILPQMLLTQGVPRLLESAAIQRRKGRSSQPAFFELAPRHCGVRFQPRDLIGANFRWCANRIPEPP